MITAIDIGASKTLLAQFDSNGNIVNNFKFATHLNQSEFYAELVGNLKKLHEISVLSVGAPGIVDPLGVIRRCGVLPWEDFDLKGLLDKDFRCPVFIENDAKLAGLAEANAMTPLPELCLYITVSTGIGEGVIQKGKLVDALKYSEAGHMIVWNDDRWQPWQDVASGKAIKRHFGRLAKDLTSKEDWDWIADKLVLGLSALVPTIQPDVIIFGGSVGHYFDKFEAPLTTLLNKRLPKFIQRPKLVGAKHPDEAVIYGCYHYATHKRNS